MKTIIYKVDWGYFEDDYDIDDLIEIIFFDVNSKCQIEARKSARYALYQMKLMIDCVLNEQDYVIFDITKEEACRRQEKIDKEDGHENS